MTDAYVDLRGVRTWYGEVGEGPPLVMLHPGGVDSRALAPNVGALAEHFHVWLPERRGHGRTPDVDGPYSYDVFADDAIQFLEQVVGGPARLFGMSDGAIVALHVALKRPPLVERLVLAGGVFHTDGWLPGVLVAPDEGASAFERKLFALHTSGPRLTHDDLATIRCRTLVMVGDDDEMDPEHTLELYQRVLNGELAVVPGTSHGFLVEKPQICNALLLDFLTTDPVRTFAPIRRA
jgi:pimeloyl-ACP methyl ester carboxylesterase